MDRNCFINIFYYILKPYHELKSGERNVIHKDQGNVIPVMFKNSVVKN